MTTRLARAFLLVFCLTGAGLSQAGPLTTLLVNEVVIERSMADVFEYASTADNWNEWHPNTRFATGASDHSATEGELIIEHLKIGSAPSGNIYWIVTQHMVPSQWQIRGIGQGGFIRYLITYKLSMTDSGATLFRRELQYELNNNAVNALMNLLVFKPFLTLMSDQAIQQFKAALEK